MPVPPMLRTVEWEARVGHDREQKKVVVFIAPDDVLRAWRARAASTDEVVSVSASEPHPLEVITRQQPQIVVLEESVAYTERGAALIGQLRTDRALHSIDIRVLSSDWVRRSEEQGTITSLAALATPIRPSYPIARRAPRRRVSGVDAEIDGQRVTLIDLSIGGAQVLSAVALRLDQHVRIVWADSIAIDAKVVWVTLEMTPAPRYRAGIEFVAVDAHTLSRLLPPA